MALKFILMASFVISFSENVLLLFIPCHMIVAGYYCFTLDVHVSVRLSIGPSYVSLSVYRFRMIWVNINGFSPNLVCALMLWRSVWDCWWANFVKFWRSYLPEKRPYFHFRMITWVNINGFSPNLVCALILWRSALVLLMGKFRQILTELSARDMPIFSFPDDNLSKCQGILTKLGTCIDMKEIWFWIANGKFGLPIMAGY